MKAGAGKAAVQGVAATVGVLDRVHVRRLYYVQLYSLYYTALCCTIVTSAALYCTVMPNTPLCCTVVQNTTRYCTVMPNTALCCTVVPNTFPYCTLMPYTAICCTVVPNTAL